ncbi:hypothetical protein ABBQ38_002306 [Trebouxia sp. C0009 RCD-2024]
MSAQHAAAQAVTFNHCGLQEAKAEATKLRGNAKAVLQTEAAVLGKHVQPVIILRCTCNARRAIALQQALGDACVPSVRFHRWGLACQHLNLVWKV